MKQGPNPEEDKIAVVQREEGNVLLRGLLAATKIIGSTALVLMFSGIVVLVQDHFRLDEIVKGQSRIESTLVIHAAKLDAIEPVVLPENQWSFSMEIAANEAISSMNPAIKMPDIREIKRRYSKQ